jgi:hypothetical protein
MFFGLNNSYGRSGKPDFLIGTDFSTRLFLNNGNGANNPAVQNSDFYPEYLTSNKNEFVLLNGNSSSLGQKPDGTFVSGWNTNQANVVRAKQLVNQFPRRMLQNLLVVPAKDGTAVPIAGSYFIKLMDHAPGTVEPLSCLITDANGEIEGLTITGNLSLSGDPDGDTAINTLGKSNTIDCGLFDES